MVLYEGFRATNVWKAFTLNSIVAALVIMIAMLMKQWLDTYQDEKGRSVTRVTSFKSVSLTLIATFLASFGAYTIMHFVFDFGGGMETSVNPE